MPANFRELLVAFELAEPGIAEAFLCRTTGKIYFCYDDPGIAGEEEVLPDDIEDSENYVRLPHRRNLGLGKPLALDFARSELPDDFDEVLAMFSRRGGFSRFKRLLQKRYATDRWYAFERGAGERALRSWCEEEGIELVE